MDPHRTVPTDDTVVDLQPADLHTSDPTATAHLQADPTGGRRRSRRVVAAAVALAVLAGAATAVVAGGGSSSPTPRAAGAEVDLVAAGPGATLPPAASPTDPQGDPGAGPQTDAPEAQPQPQPEPPASPGVLTVDASVLWMMAGDYDGAITVRNQGGSPIDWSFEPGIGAMGVSQSGGTLAPGASTVVSYSLNPFTLADGPFVFVSHVVGGGFDRAITIHGVKTPIVVNPDIPKGPKNITP